MTVDGHAILSDEDRQAFYERGFLTLRNVIPPDLADAALRAINESLGTTGVRPTLFTEPCEELGSSPLLADLVYGSTLWPAAKQLIGPDVEMTDSAQVALRFPRPDEPTGPIDEDAPVERLVRYTPHIDEVRRMPRLRLPRPQQVHVRAGDAVVAHYMLGHGIAENLSPHIRYAVYFRLDHRLRQHQTVARWAGPTRNVLGFTCLIGVFLSDAPADDMGNLVVWPGSHHVYERYYRNHTTEAREDFTYPQFTTGIWREWDGLRDIVTRRSYEADQAS